MKTLSQKDRLKVISDHFFAYSSFRRGEGTPPYIMRR